MDMQWVKNGTCQKTCQCGGEHNYHVD
jgi:hypothetical protein